MKKVIFLVVINFLSSFQCCFAQYKVALKDEYRSDTLWMVNYTYVCDTLINRVHLRNIDNSDDKGLVVYKDTGELPDGDLFEWSHVNHIQKPIELQRRMAKIVDDAFTVDQAASLNGKFLMIKLYISSVTGEITDVYFNFHKSTGYSQIPIAVFRTIELQLKEQIVFELTEEGRKMNYCYLAWTQCPTGYVAPTLDPDMPFDGSGGGGGEGYVQTGPVGSIISEPMEPPK